MQYTAKPSPPVNRPQNPRKKRLSGYDRLRKALANVARRADELLEIGYRFERSRTVHARIDVIKPGQTEPTHFIDFDRDPRTQQMRYRCSCELFHWAESSLQWDPDIQPQCKHGRRAMSLFLGALQFIEHIEPLPPVFEGEVARAQRDPDGPQPRFCLDQNNPWPTKRAGAVASVEGRLRRGPRPMRGRDPHRDQGQRRLAPTCTSRKRWRKKCLGLIPK